MNTTFKNIDLDALELAPVIDINSEASDYVARHLAALVPMDAKAVKPAVKKLSVTENDSAFQRALTAVTGFLLPTKPGNDAAPSSTDPHTAPTAPVPTAIVIKSQQQLRTLYHLLHAGEAGIPIVDFEPLVGVANPGDPVSKLNKKFARRIIETTMHPVKNKTGNTTERGNYWLTEEGKHIARQILANSGYVHDSAPNDHYLRRPSKVASEFIATHSLDGDDLLLLRDSTKPQWLRLLYLLRAVNGAWVPRYVADELLDSRNVSQAVRDAELKVGAPAIDRHTRTMPNRDAGTCDYGLYRITNEWVAKVDKVIADHLASARKVSK